MKFTPETYREEVKTLFPHIEVYGDYNGVLNKIEHYCNNSKTRWESQPRQVLMGKCCRECSRKKLAFSQEHFDSLLNEIPGYECLDPYVNTYTTLTFKHTCGFEFQTTPERFLKRNVRCRNCNPPKQPKNFWCKATENEYGMFPSKFEASCGKLIFDKFGLNDIQRNKPYDSSSLKTCDFYIVSKDLWIEVSTLGKSWYLERIENKRKLVNNFLFFSKISELKEYLKEV